jgi:hypothetical protein
MHLFFEVSLWQRTTQRMLGQEAEPVIAPAKDDRRAASVARITGMRSCTRMAAFASAMITG